MSDTCQTDMRPVRTVRFLRVEEVLTRTGIATTKDLDRRIRRGEFPKGQALSPKVRVWPEPQVARWQFDLMDNVAQAACAAVMAPPIDDFSDLLG